MALLTICSICGCIYQGGEAPANVGSMDANESNEGREKVMLGCLDITRIDEMNAWKNSTPNNISEAEEYAVYNAIIGKREPGMEVNRSGIMIISSNTSPVWEPYHVIPRELPGLEQDTLEDYNEKNMISYTLKNLFDLSAIHVLANSSDIDELYEDFDLKSCTDVPLIISLSRVGFNEDKTQALVEFGYAFWHVGSGELKLLQKEDGNWTEKTSMMTWIA
jgi:hypothetical protein